MRTVTIIGAGRIGRALALALPADRFRVDKLVGRTTTKSSGIVAGFDSLKEIASDIIFITTQDPLIEGVARRIAEMVRPDAMVFHMSGSRSSLILNSLSAKGCKAGSIHPLISISSPELGIKRFPGAFFCIEGDPAAIDAAHEIVQALGGRPFSIDTEKKSLYHAAAVMSSGHLVALIDTAVEMMVRCGVSPDFARLILMPLVRSTVDNLGEQPAAAALTGPFARADAETVEAHIAALRHEELAEALEIYLALGERSLDLSIKQGTEIVAVERLRKMVLMAKDGSE